MERVYIGFLTAIGVVALTLGIAMATAVGAPTSSGSSFVATSLEDAEYVGSASCFQCHDAQHQEWSLVAHHDDATLQADANPEYVLADFSPNANFRISEINGEARPYAIDNVIVVVGGKDEQRNRTEIDTSRLPGDWNLDATIRVELPAEAFGADCAGCHATGYDSGTQGWNEMGVTCEACHGPASVHIETAQLLEPGVDDRSVRESIVGTVEAAVCDDCHGADRMADEAHHFLVDFIAGNFVNESTRQETHTWRVVRPVDVADVQCTGSDCRMPGRDVDTLPENYIFMNEGLWSGIGDRVEVMRTDLDEVGPDRDPYAEDRPEERIAAERIRAFYPFVEIDENGLFDRPDERFGEVGEMTTNLLPGLLDG